MNIFLPTVEEWGKQQAAVSDAACAKPNSGCIPLTTAQKAEYSSNGAAKYPPCGPGIKFTSLNGLLDPQAGSIGMAAAAGLLIGSEYGWFGGIVGGIAVWLFLPSSCGSCLINGKVNSVGCGW